MNRKRALYFAIIPILALVWAMKSAASWRPQVVGVQQNAYYPWASDDGRSLAVGFADPTIGSPYLAGFQMWDVETRRPLWKSRPHDCVLAMTPDSRALVLLHLPSQSSLVGVLDDLEGAQFELRDQRTGRLLHTLEKCDFAPTDQSLDYYCSPAGDEFILITRFCLRRWSLATGKLLALCRWTPPKNQKLNLSAASGTSDKTQILAYEVSQGIMVFDARTGRCVGSMPQFLSPAGPTDTIDFLLVNPDGYSFYAERTGRKAGGVFRVSDSRLLWTPINTPTLSKEGKLAYVPTNSGLDVFEARTGRQLNHIPGPKEYGFDLSPDGNYLYEAGGGKIYRWRAR